MIKKLLIGIISVLPLTMAAQSFTSMSFEEAQAKATAQKKIILVDVTNAKMVNDAKAALEKKVLETGATKEFIENNIVSIRINMGTPEGAKFAPLLQMNMYPTYAFLMPNGDMLGVVSPYSLDKNPALFLEKAISFKEKAVEKWSNSRKIEMASITFEDALVIAKKEKKLIFLDAYTDNCQPCMMMEKNVFTQDKVADFYNANFINLSMNLGTEHTKLAEKYGTSGYPSFLFIDGNGKLISFESGYTEADKFLQYGKDALAKMSIQFTEGTWKEILALAAKENKPIFVDCYTVWCGPCKQMAAEVFTDPMVAEYFNATYINVKVDMEKGEGIDLKNHYEVKAFPTFLYLDPKGNVVSRIVGSMPAADFVKASKKGMSESGLAAMNKRYASGERGEKFIGEYLKVLEEAYLQKEAQAVVVEYFSKFELSALKEKKNWDLFAKYIEDANSEAFKYVHANRPEFYALFGKEQVEARMMLIWSIGSRSFVSKTNDGVSFDSKGFNAFIKRMKQDKAEKQNLIVVNAKMHNAEMLGDWKTYISIAESKMKDAGGIEKLPAMELYNWGLRVDQGCAEMKLRAKAAQWYSKMAPILEAAEAKRQEEAKKSGTVMAMSMVAFEKEYKRLATSLSQEIKKK